MGIEEQSAYIDSLVHASDRRNEWAESIQKLYEECAGNFSEKIFDKMIIMLEERTGPWVCRHLKNAGSYTDENEHTAIQESRIAVWNTINRAKKNNEMIDHFAYYAFAIYKKRTLDCIRNVSRMRQYYYFASAEDTDYKDNGIYPPYYDDYGEIREKRKVFDGVFRIYCISLLNSDAFPPRCLALFYARILPHLLFEIPDSKGASAKWAFERMAERTVGRLTQDSERVIKNDIDHSMRWGQSYMSQLDQEIHVSGKNWRLRDVVYTSEYDKDKIEDWAEYMHKVIMKDAYMRLCQDHELLELVKSYLSTEKVLQKIWKGKEDKNR